MNVGQNYISWQQYMHWNTQTNAEELYPKTWCHIAFLTGTAHTNAGKGKLGMAFLKLDSTELMSVWKLTASEISRKCTRNIHSSVYTHVHAVPRIIIRKRAGWKVACLLRLLQQNYAIGGKFNGKVPRAVCVGDCNTCWAPEISVRNLYHVVRGRRTPADP